MKLIKNPLVSAGIITPLLNTYPVRSGTELLNRILPGFGMDPIISIYTKEGEESYWVEDADAFLTVSKKFFANKLLLAKMYSYWAETESAFYTQISKFSVHGIKSLLEDFRDFNAAYYAEYTPALIVDYFYIGSEYIYCRVIRKYPKLKHLVDSAVRPLRATFSMENELSLCKIALIKDKKQMEAAVKKHQQDFFWLHNNYKYTKPLTAAYFMREVNKIMKNKEEEIRFKIADIIYYDAGQRSVLKQLKDSVDKDTFSAIYWLSKIGYWHDRRKRANLVADYWVNEFAKKAEKKLNFPFKKLQFLTPEELLGLLEGKKLDVGIMARMKGCLQACYSDGTTIFLTGKKYEKAKKQLLVQKVSKDVKGVGVSLGKAAGKVRVIKSPNEKINNGEILVTSMTRPDFMPLVKKAAAIVTDEGGITCHAAIVSRELKIPCIVGTKTATKALKTGMKVEVDADKGIVKVLR